MTNYHIINASTKIVENSVEWDGDTNKWAPLDGFVAIASTVSGIGWKYNSEGVGIGTTSGDITNMWIPQIGYGTTI